MLLCYVYVGTLLQLCHFLLRLSSSSMLVWMHWILRSGNLLVTGIAFFLFLLEMFVSDIVKGELNMQIRREISINS